MDQTRLGLSFANFYVQINNVNRYLLIKGGGLIGGMGGAGIIIIGGCAASI